MVDRSPISGYGMQSIAVGIENTIKAVRRKEYMCFAIQLHKCRQPTRMVSVSMGYKSIIHLGEINAQTLGIANKNITCTRVKQ